MRNDESVPSTASLTARTTPGRLVPWLAAAAVAALLELGAASLVGRVGRVWYNPFTWSDPPEVGTLSNGSPYILPAQGRMQPRRVPPLITATRRGNETNLPAGLKESLP